jgi:hypothetical protein
MVLFGQLLILLCLLVSSFNIGGWIANQQTPHPFVRDTIYFGPLLVAALQYAGFYRRERWACLALYLILFIVGLLVSLVAFFILLITFLFMTHAGLLLFGLSSILTAMAIFLLMCSKMNYAWSDSLYVNAVVPVPRTQFSIQDICSVTFALLFTLGAAKLWAEFWFRMDRAHLQ